MDKLAFLTGILVGAVVISLSWALTIPRCPHVWSKWQTGKQTYFATIDGIPIASVPQWSAEIQRRCCETCGKCEDREI